MIHIEQTHRLLWSTFLKTIKQLHNVTWKKHIFYEKSERLNYKLKETLLRDRICFLNYSKLIPITLSILRTLTRAFILLSQIRHQSTKRTLYVTGEYVVPTFPSIFGGCSPSMGTILYLLTMAVKNKKNSILANDSPRQTLLPEIHIYINGFFSK